MDNAMVIGPGRAAHSAARMIDAECTIADRLPDGVSYRAAIADAVSEVGASASETDANPAASIAAGWFVVSRSIATVFETASLAAARSVLDLPVTIIA